MIVILTGALSALMAWENRGHRTCVLDGELGQYKCFIGEHSVETGLFHNVYIRLKGQKHGKHILIFKNVKKKTKTQSRRTAVGMSCSLSFFKQLRCFLGLPR